MKFEIGNKTTFFLAGLMFMLAGLGSTTDWLMWWGIIFVGIAFVGIILGWWEKKDEHTT